MDLINNFLSKTKYNFRKENELYYFRKNNKVKLPTKLDSNLAYLIGLIQGDGHLKSNEKRIGLSINSFEFLEKYNQLVKQLFDYEVKAHRKKDKKLLFDVMINNIVIYEFIRINFNLCIGKKKNKLFLPILIKESDTLFLAWLAGFVDSDGYVTKNAALQIVQSSHQILKDIQDKLNIMYNIKGKIIYNKANDAYYLSFKQGEFSEFKHGLAHQMNEVAKIEKMRL